MRSKNTGARKALENVIHLVFLLCGIVAVGFVLVISVYLILSGLPAIRQIGLFRFLFGQVWDPTNTTTGAEYGILPFILTSVYGTAGAMVIGVPIGLMTAIFLSKLAPAPVAAVIRTAVQLLAGIPSVVYGLVGMIVLVPLIRTTFSLGSGACLLAAILVLSIMGRPAWPWEPPPPRRISASAFTPPAAAWPPPWCWAWAGPSARPWPSSWWQAMWPICRGCSGPSGS